MQATNVGFTRRGLLTDPFSDGSVAVAYFRLYRIWGAKTVSRSILNATCVALLVTLVSAAASSVLADAVRTQVRDVLTSSPSIKGLRDPTTTSASSPSYASGVPSVIDCEALRTVSHQPESTRRNAYLQILNIDPATAPSDDSWRRSLKKALEFCSI